jgi:hypothetical protein
LNSGGGEASVDGQAADGVQGLEAVNAITEPCADEMDEGRDETIMADEEGQMEDEF